MENNDCTPCLKSLLFLKLSLWMALLSIGNYPFFVLGHQIQDGSEGLSKNSAEQYRFYNILKYPVEERNQWGSWGDFSKCSKSCGVGLYYRKRTCYLLSNEIPIETSKNVCGDEVKEYKTCNAQKCPDGDTEDYRAKQCGVYDRIPYSGKFYKWKPYEFHKGSHSSVFDPCSLMCTTDREPYTIAVKFSNRVLDGTACESKKTKSGICVEGNCVHLGCDKVLYSNTSIDNCGVCGGDNRTCRRIRKTITKSVKLGYNSLLRIPRNSRHIQILEKEGSTAVFALRNAQGFYFVNGKHSVSYPTVYSDVGGTTFYYHHPLYDKEGFERLSADGPTNETLYVMMLSPVPQGQKVHLSYEYTVPNQASLGSKHKTQTTLGALKLLTDKKRQKRRKYQQYYNRYQRRGGDQNLSIKNSRIPAKTGNNKPQKYSWKNDDKAHCSATCSDGVQTTYAFCYRWDNLKVDDRYCSDQEKPEANYAHCKGKTCEPRWVTSPWSKCSVSCGDGQQSRSLRCWRVLAPGLDSSVRNFMCDTLEKPVLTRSCKETECGPQWETSDWGDCSSKCGPGLQWRQVKCSGGQCAEEKPVRFRKCNMGDCVHDWSVSAWSQCSGPCGSGWRRRSVTCRDLHGQLFHDKFCDERQRPISVEACGDKPDCPHVWVIQDWGVCSVECGEGVTQRQIICGHVTKGAFEVQPDSYCAHLYKPSSQGLCREKHCKASWYTTEWSKCSKTCGRGGARIRKVSCYENDQPSNNCDASTRPPAREYCILQECRGGDKNEDDDCQDDPNTNCRYVRHVRLCGNWNYKTVCCKTCKQELD